MTDSRLQVLRETWEPPDEKRLNDRYRLGTVRIGLGGRIRTCGVLDPNQALWPD